MKNLQIKKAVLLPLDIYQNYIRYYLPSTCRFYPSCSSYMHEAIETHGIAMGSRLGLQRLLKCHPFHEGGFDPVPKPMNKDITSS